MEAFVQVFFKYGLITNDILWGSAEKLVEDVVAALSRLL